MKNLLLVANWESGVGYAWWLMENFWAEIARAFAPRGHEVYLMYPKITRIPKSIASSPIECLEYDFGDFSRRGRQRLGPLLRRLRIDSVYLTDHALWTSRYLWLRVCGIRRIVVHDHAPGAPPSARGVRRIGKQLVQRTRLLAADHYLATTAFVADRLASTGCVPRTRITVVPNGIRPIGRDPALRYYAHREFGLPRDVALVVCASRASRYKGLDFLVECAAELIHRRGLTNVCFLHCGDGPDLPALRKLAIERCVDRRFVFAGLRPDVTTLLQSCDVGIQASRGEVGYSLSILEYMSSGLATLVPDSPSLRQATEHERTGLLFRPGDVQSACDNLERVLSDRELRLRLGAAASREVETRFHLATTNRRLIEALEQVLEPSLQLGSENRRESDSRAG